MSFSIEPAARAALFDIDGTLTEASGGSAWNTLIHAPTTKKSKRSWLYCTGLPHYMLSKVGLVSQAGFRNRWVQLMAWLMAGWSEVQVEDICEQTVAEGLIPTVRADVVALLNRHVEAGQPVILVSTMFEGIVDGFASYVGATAGVGSEVGFQNGTCTGNIVGQTCSGGRKVEFARRYLARHHPDLTLNDCAAYADSASDIAFISEFGYPTAVYPEDTMRVEAVSRGWPIYEGN